MRQKAILRFCVVGENTGGNTGENAGEIKSTIIPREAQKAAKITYLTSTQI